jgi:hypothetical protein
MHFISIVRSLYFKTFSASFLIKFLFPGIVPFSLSRIIMSGLLLGKVIIIIIIIIIIIKA